MPKLEFESPADRELRFRADARKAMETADPPVMVFGDTGQIDKKGRPPCTWFRVETAKSWSYVFFPQDLWDSWTPEEQEEAKIQIACEWKNFVAFFFGDWNTWPPARYRLLIEKWMKEKGLWNHYFDGEHRGEKNASGS